MKKYINKLTNAVVIIILFTTISCTNGLDGQGFIDDPTTNSEAPTPNILGIAKLNSIYLAESDESRYAGISSNYITGLSNQWVTLNDYSFNPGDFTGLWTSVYVDGIKPCKIAQSQGNADNDMEMVATAQLFEALFTIEAAALWGDIPFSQAVNPNFAFPVFDSQVSVIQGGIDLLDQAISNAGSSRKYLNDGIGGISTGGLGNGATIAQVANSLKARAYMLLRDYPNAIIAAQNGINSSDKDMIGEHSTTLGGENLYYQFLVVQRNGDTGPDNSYIEAMLNPTDNSVTRTLATPGDTDRYDFYFTSSSEFNTTNGIFAQTASMPVVSYYETKLIEAEALYRDNQEGAARIALNEVRTSLATEFGGVFPASTATGGTLLTHILEEKYITIFPSPQTFHDLRRTDNQLGIALKTGTELPQRFIYSQDEIDANENTPNPLPGVFVPTPINN